MTKKTRRIGSEATPLVPKSRAMRHLLDLAERVAPTNATVLITGETGTGKERLARLIHDRSRRREGPFLAINCGAVPDTLLEGELFGHKKGAFTGADADKKGVFEAGAGGTVLLDEIGETSQAMQVRLLRVLQEHTVRPVGATADSSVDIRILASTHQDLEQRVRERTFRKDLLFRLRVVELRIPPLRERQEDLLPLARQFIGRFCSEYSCGPCSLNPEVLDILMAYDWPGNIRELENAIERAVVLAEDRPHIEPPDLPPEVRASVMAIPNQPSGEILTLAEVERRHIVAVLERLGDNRKETAKALGVGETTLWRKLKAYGLVRPREPRS